MWGGGGRKWGWSNLERVQSRLGKYTYVGPCRCGFGPHAYYMDEKGRIVHARFVVGGPVHTLSEAEELFAEKEQLERRLQEIEKRIRELEKKE
ncbi:MAG: hypothetical protein ACPLSJ_06620 [Thermosulfidibacteraceae bacterium]|jgi:hypothetical protein